MWKDLNEKHDGGNLASEADTELILNNWTNIDNKYMVKQWNTHLFFNIKFFFINIDLSYMFTLPLSKCE